MQRVWGAHFELVKAKAQMYGVVFHKPGQSVLHYSVLIAAIAVTAIEQGILYSFFTAFAPEINHIVPQAGQLLEALQDDNASPLEGAEEVESFIEDNQQQLGLSESECVNHVLGQNSSTNSRLYNITRSKVFSRIINSRGCHQRLDLAYRSGLCIWIITIFKLSPLQLANSIN